MEDETEYSYLPPEGQQPIKQPLDAVDLGMAVWGLRTLMNPQDYQIADENIRSVAMQKIKEAGWIIDGEISPPPEIWSLVFRK